MPRALAGPLPLSLRADCVPGDHLSPFRYVRGTEWAYRRFTEVRIGRAAGTLVGVDTALCWPSGQCAGCNAFIIIISMMQPYLSLLF
jgi:hypothetical protein